eukprot:449384-Amphidinium_carterae.5
MEFKDTHFIEHEIITTSLFYDTEYMKSFATQHSEFLETTTKDIAGRSVVQIAPSTPRVHGS